MSVTGSVVAEEGDGVSVSAAEEGFAAIGKSIAQCHILPLYKSPSNLSGNSIIVAFCFFFLFSIEARVITINIIVITESYYYLSRWGKKTLLFVVF